MRDSVFRISFIGDILNKILWIDFQSVCFIHFFFVFVYYVLYFKHEIMKKIGINNFQNCHNEPFFKNSYFL